MSLKPVIVKLVDGQDLCFDEARDAMRIIMAGKASDAQIGCILTALRMKGEKVEEVAGFASAMKEYCQRITPKVNGRLLDTCGTGGNKFQAFNISTISAFVAAGAGVVIAKHGNRSYTSKCGSADVLEALGYRLDLSPSEVERLIEKVGVGFMYAPVFHPAMKHAIGPRQELGIKTVFNILGPLTNPADANTQLLGVHSPELTESMAFSLRTLGIEEAMVVHGYGGMGEISTAGSTRVSSLQDGQVKTTDVKPGDFGVNEAPLAKLRGGTPEQGARVAYKVLVGEAEKPQMDVVLVNSSAGIKMAGLADSLKHGMELARESIDSGRAYCKLREMVRMSGGNLSRLEQLEHG